jgi:hypothetical protein
MWLCACGNLNNTWVYECQYCGRSEDEANEQFESQVMGVSGLPDREYPLGEDL